MNFRIKKTWIAAVGLLTAMSTAGGIALAVGGVQAADAGPDPTLPDPDRTAIALKLYDASGAVVTSGSTTTPLAAFAAADSAPRSGDEYATLYAHLPDPSSPEGSWSGVQVTGTDKFAGAGAVSATGLTGKAYVRTNAAGSYTLANVIAALPQQSTATGYAGVYELRLRSSSPTDGVATKYAATYLKVTGNSWAVTAAPPLGGGGTTTTPPTTTPPAGAVATTVVPGWPGSLTYGTPASVSVSVNPASGAAKPTGTVTLVNGAATVATATLANGTATFSVPATAFNPGAVSLKVVYAGVAGTWGASESPAKAFTVAKATPGSPTYQTDKAPTTRKKGSATVTIPTPAGLAAASGTAKVVLTKGKVVKTIAVTVTGGKATVKLPKLPKGKWKVVVTYDGDAHYLGATSASYTLKVKAPKKKK
jgi:hypothetical protein